MTEKEFSILIKGIKGMKAIYAQPNFIPDAYAFKVWFSLLEDLNYKDASAAIQKHMQRRNSSNSYMNGISNRVNVVDSWLTGGANDSGGAND